MSQRTTAFKFMMTMLSPMALAFIILHALDPLTAGLRADRWEKYIPRSIGVPGEKFAYLADHKDEYTGLFLGSSALYVGIDPTLIDRRLSEAGLQEKTYNFGMPGKPILPQYDFLKSVLALRPRKLRWVVFDLTSASYDNRPLPDAIDLYWFHFDQARWLLRSLSRLDVPAPRKTFYLLRAGLMIFKSLFAPGNAALWIRRDLLFARGDHAPHDQAEGQYPQADGQWPRFDRSGYMKILSEGIDRVPSYSPTVLVTIQHIASLAAESGIQLIFFVPPLAVRAAPLELDASIQPLIRFDNPRNYPELYSFQNRWDEDHVNATGASVLSRLLADALVPILTQNASRSLSGK